jgi:hypothetical protein
MKMDYIPHYWQVSLAAIAREKFSNILIATSLDSDPPTFSTGN